MEIIFAEAGETLPLRKLNIYQHTVISLNGLL